MVIGSGRHKNGCESSLFCVSLFIPFGIFFGRNRPESALDALGKHMEKPEIDFTFSEDLKKIREEMRNHCGYGFTIREQLDEAGKAVINDISCVGTLAVYTDGIVLSNGGVSPMVISGATVVIVACNHVIDRTPVSEVVRLQLRLDVKYDDFMRVFLQLTLSRKPSHAIASTKREASPLVLQPA